MNKKLIILTTLLATLLTSSFMGGAPIVYAQEVDEDQVAAEAMLSMLIDSEAEITSLFETIIGEGGEVPEEAQDKYNEAQELHLEAQALYDEGNYLESMEKATEALNKYGEALTEASPEEPEVLTTEEIEQVEATDELVGLFSAVENARNRLDKLDKILDGYFNDLGMDVSAAKADIQALRDELLAFEEKLNDPTIPRSEINFGQITKRIAHLIGEIKRMGKPIKTQKLEQFQQKTMKHITKLDEKMNKILAKMGTSEENMMMLQSQFGDIYGQIEDMDKEDMKEAIKQLRKMVKETKNVGKGTEVEELLGEDGLESIHDQVKTESELEYYQSVINEMSEEDPSKLEAEALIEQLTTLLEEAEMALVEENEDLADEMMSDVEDILDQLGDLLGKGKGKGPKPGKGPKVGKGPKADKGPKTPKSNGKGHNKDN